MIHFVSIFALVRVRRLHSPTMLVPADPGLVTRLGVHKENVIGQTSRTVAVSRKRDRSLAIFVLTLSHTNGHPRPTYAFLRIPFSVKFVLLLWMVWLPDVTYANQVLNVVGSCPTVPRFAALGIGADEFAIAAELLLSRLAKRNALAKPRLVKFQCISLETTSS